MPLLVVVAAAQKAASNGETHAHAACGVRVCVITHYGVS